MDSIDLQILKTLQSNGRITNSELAKTVGLSAPSVLERVRKLEEQQIITGYTARIDARKVGRGQTCYVAISLSLHQIGNIQIFQDNIEAIPEVIECYHITGEEDFLLKVKVRDVQHYEEVLLQHFTKLEGLSKIKTMIVLSTLKKESPLMLDEAELNLINQKSLKKNR